MPHYCVLAKAAAAQAEKGSASPAVWRGCCVQAAPVALTPPGSSGFQRHGVTQHPLPALLPGAQTHTHLPAAPCQARGARAPTPRRRICPGGISSAPSLPSPARCRLRVPHLSLPQQVQAPRFELLSPSHRAAPRPCHNSYPSPSLGFASDLRQQ